MRHIAINILKQDKGFKAGLKRKMRKAAKQQPHTLTLGWDEDEGIVMEFDATGQDEGQGESA